MYEYNGVEKIERGEPLFAETTVTKAIVSMLNDDKAGNYLTKRVKKMSNDLNNATEQLDKYLEVIRQRTNDVTQSEKAITESVKQVSGKVRDAYQRISDGVQRIEKTANFERLERMVALLERAEAAMSSLAELEKSGKLDKILTAIK